MAKFEVMVTEHVQRAVSYTIEIKKADVVKELGLEGDDAKNWTEHAQDYISENWGDLYAKAVRGDVDESEGDTDVDDVTLLDE